MGAMSERCSENSKTKSRGIAKTEQFLNEISKYAVPEPYNFSITDCRLKRVVIELLSDIPAGHFQTCYFHYATIFRRFGRHW